MIKILHYLSAITVINILSFSSRSYMTSPPINKSLFSPLHETIYTIGLSIKPSVLKWMSREKLVMNHKKYPCKTSIKRIKTIINILNLIQRLETDKTHTRNDDHHEEESLSTDEYDAPNDPDKDQPDPLKDTPEKTPNIEPITDTSKETENKNANVRIVYTDTDKKDLKQCYSLSHL